MSSEKRAFAAVAIVSFFWGTTYIVSRFTVENIPGLYLAAVRNLMAGTFIIAFSFLRGKKLPDFKSLRNAALLGIIMIAMSSGLSHWSVQYISGSLAAIIGATIPLWLAIFSFSKKILSGQLVTGLLLGFAGIAIIFYDHLAELFMTDFRFGVFLAAFSCITWSASSVYTSRIKFKMGLLYTVGWQMFFAGIFLFIVCRFAGFAVPLAALPAETWYGIFYLTAIGSVVTYSCYIYAIQNLPPARAGVYAYINPMVAVILGYLWLDEKFNAVIATGTLVTILGIYLVNSGFRKSKRLHTEINRMKEV